MTIRNNTENVVVVSNSAFRKEIPIHMAVEVSDKDIGESSVLEIEYFSKHEEEKNYECGVERGFNRKLHPYFFAESVFPIKTVVQAANVAMLELNSDDIHLPMFILFFKKIVLKSVSCTDENKKTVKTEKRFHTRKDKKRLLEFLLVETLLLFIILLGLLAVTVSMFRDGSAIEYRIGSVLITAVLLLCEIVNVNCFMQALRWKL